MKSRGSAKRMIGLFKPYKKLLCIVIIGVMLDSGINIIWPLLTKYFLDIVISNQIDNIYHVLLKCFIGLISMLLMNILSQWIMTVKASVLTDSIRFDLQQKIYDKYMTLSNDFYDESRVGSILSLLDQDVSRVEEFLYFLSTNIATVVINVIGAIIIFTSISLKITLALIPPILLVAIFNNFHGKIVVKVFKEVRDNNTTRMEEAEDKLSGVRTIISFGKERSEMNHFFEVSKTVANALSKAWIQSWIRNCIGVLFRQSVNIIIIIVGGYMTLKGELSLSELLVMYMYSGMIAYPVQNITENIKSFNKATVSFEEIEKHLNTEASIKSPKNGYDGKINGDISFEKCSFKYKEDGNEVINNIDFEVKAGKSMAIVGPSGSGKSTIASLIPRYYDVSNGSIKIDGINVKDFNLYSLRRNIGVIQQDIYLFFGTVYDNITYASPNVTMEEVIRAAKMANAHDFISELPNGYNTNIGDRGVKLSGGQKQRIAIARVFLLNPPIIIFDEATSALDNASEKEVQKAMENLSRSRTIITIAHRLSTIKNADEIIYLSKDGIEEKGTHDYLMKLNGKYAELYNSSDR